MDRPPRDARDGIFSGGLGIDVVLQGIVVTLLTLAAYCIGSSSETGAVFSNSGVGMTMAFLTLSLVETFHAFNLRARRKSLFSLRHQNKWLWASAALSVVLSLAVVLIPGLRTAFSFAPVNAPQMLISLGLALSILPIMELAKLILRRLKL